jgi:hypothetical protein
MSGLKVGEVILISHTSYSTVYGIIEKRLEFNPLSLANNFPQEVLEDIDTPYRRLGYKVTRLTVNSRHVNNYTVTTVYDKAEDFEEWISNKWYSKVDVMPEGVVNWLVDRVMKGVLKSE